MSNFVFSVDGVCFAVDKSNPPQLQVSALGQVNTSGWKAPMLLPHVYVVPPADGVLDLDFMATPPSGMALQVISPITGDVAVTLVDWIKGVRVRSSTNQSVAMLGDEKCIATLGAASDNSTRSIDFPKSRDARGQSAQ
jgi:hypothetical protein